MVGYLHLFHFDRRPANSLSRKAIQDLHSQNMILVIELWGHYGSEGTSEQALTALMGNSGSGSKFSAE